LTIVTDYVTHNHLAHSRGVTGDGRLMEQARSPRAGFVTPHPGGSGPARPSLGPVCEELTALGIGGGGQNTRPSGPRKRGSGAEPMLVATGVASAAAERRKASAPRHLARFRALKTRGHWLDAPFGAPLPSFGEKNQTKLGRGLRREKEFVFPPPRKRRRMNQSRPRSGLE